MQLLAQDIPAVEEFNYETAVESAPPVDYGPLAALGIIPLIIWLVVVILGIIAMWRIFAKAGQPGWAAIVPIYNLVVLFQIIGKPAWWVLLVFIPLVNLAISIIMSLELAKVFGKSALFGIILLWFIPVGYFILAFGSAKYTAPGTTPTSTPPAPAPVAPAAEVPAQPPTPAA